MIKSVVTFLTSLVASFSTRNTRAFCLRRLVAALLFFQLVSFGVMFLHLNMSVHVISPITGEVIHGSVEHIQVSQTEQAIVQSEDISVDEDTCELFNKFLRPTVANVDLPQTIQIDQVTISNEIIARKLDIVYRSTRLLQQAPKNSPPEMLS
ncbi:MAG: hypothetical protein IIY06_08595 [Proteobacteria bacterium]|jgi:hypothetical protein|nr:hypothetical protein [Pseudomonadota bacterium]